MNTPKTAAPRLHHGLRLLFHAPVHLYRWRLGRLLGRRFLLLIHIGRHSGMRRETVLEVLEYRPKGPEAIVMSAFGTKADWLRNIESNPTVEVIIGSRHFPAAHRFLKPDEAVEVLKGYLERNRLIARIVRLVLSELAGWNFEGSQEQCRRVVEQLPLIGFRPRS